MIKKLIAIAALLACITSTISAQQKRLVGNLKLRAGAECSESYSFKGQSPYSSKQMFYASAGNETETWMNIGGREVRLRMVSTSKPTKVGPDGGELVGSRTIEKYIGPGVRVEIVKTVSWLCAVDEPGCESIGFSAVFKVKKGKRSETVKADGVFGC